MDALHMLATHVSERGLMKCARGLVGVSAMTIELAERGLIDGVREPGQHALIIGAFLLSIPPWLASSHRSRTNLGAHCRHGRIPAGFM